MAGSFALLIIVARDQLRGPIGWLILLTLVITAVVVYRQFVINRENVRLYEKLSIERSEQRFRSLVSNSFDIVLVFDTQGIIRFQSPSVTRVLGYGSDELIGRRGLDFVHRDDISEVIKVTRMLAADPKAEVMRESRFRHRNGEWRILEGIGKSFSDENGGFYGFILNSRDITHHKLVENNLRAFTRRLQRSNRELKDFAFVASHDLQEPLRKVLAFGDRLKAKYGEVLTGEGLDYLERMQGASERMRTLINDLLSFSRITTNAKPFEEVDLTEIIDEVLFDFELVLEETQTEIVVGDLPKIDADKTQMRQLFQNLIGNAIKFRKADAPPLIKIYGEMNPAEDFELIEQELNAESLENDLPKGFCRIYVEDNGIGFDEKYLDRIFTVFQRLHGRSEYEGSGVGLAVCRKITERHNGHITARSTSGKGSKFIVTMPMKQLEE
ncbi:MAG: ATP-binding protein [Pyrinomonadaceae bacterium]